MFEGISGGLLIGVLAALVLVALMRLRPPPSIEKPFEGRTLGFTTTLPIADAFRAIASGPKGERFKVLRFDAQKKRVLLSDRMSWTSWGFYYPVEFAERADEKGTDVTVGIRSKAIQFGPLVTRAHKRTIERVQALVELAQPDPYLTPQTRR